MLRFADNAMAFLWIAWLIYWFIASVFATTRHWCRGGVLTKSKGQTLPTPTVEDWTESNHA
jgi:hypothetical protein